MRLQHPNMDIEVMWSDAPVFEWLCWRKTLFLLSCRTIEKPLRYEERVNVLVWHLWNILGGLQAMCIAREYFLRKLWQRESEGCTVLLFVVLHLFSLCISVNGRKWKEMQKTHTPQVFWRKRCLLIVLLKSSYQTSYLWKPHATQRFESIHSFHSLLLDNKKKNIPFLLLSSYTLSLLHK